MVEKIWSSQTASQNAGLMKKKTHGNNQNKKRDVMVNDVMKVNEG